MNLLLWALILAFIWGLTPLYSKYLMTNGFHELFIMFLVGVVITVTTAIYMLITKVNIQDQWSLFIKNINMVYFIIWVLFTFLITGFVYFKLLKEHHTALVNAIISIYPFITLLAGYFILHEKIKAVYFIAIGLIVAALYLLHRTLL